MVPDLQLELSVSRCQVPDYTTSRVLCVNNVCVNVGFFMCASMPHKELTFFALSASQVAGFPTSSRRFQSFPLQAPSNSSRVACCFLSASTFSADKRVVFSSFLCSVNPLDCSHSRIILILVLAPACTTPAAIPLACKIHTDGLCLQVSIVSSTLGNGLSMSAVCRLSLADGASSAMQIPCHFKAKSWLCNL